jgi:putative ABC transport system substrate-binding protein
VKRRALLSLIAGLAIVRPPLAWAQAPQSRAVVVFLTPGAAPRDLTAQIIIGLNENGQVEGRDFDFVYREAQNDAQRLKTLIADVVAQRPAVIVSPTTGLAVALHQATAEIPIVNTAITDPVGLGLATSLAHPGGNFTGISSASADTGKVLELLLQVTPNAKVVGFLLNPNNTAHTRPSPETDASAMALGVSIERVWARTPHEIETAFQSLVQVGAGALFIGQDPLFNEHAKAVADLALSAKLATIYGFRFLPDAGGLMSYGGNSKDRYHRVGWYVAQILKGHKPSDLPIEQQEKLELIINLKTATALGLTVPPSLLAQADELIE